MIYPKFIISFLIVAIALWFIPSEIGKNFQGLKPTEEFESYQRSQVRSEFFDDSINALYDKALQNKSDIPSWKLLSNSIAAKVQSLTEPPQGLVLELIDSMRHVLELAPDDKETLLNMGNISYNFQAFDKAAEYFKLYLDIENGDFNTRATYASALTFNGDFDTAEKELLFTLAKEPSHFLARANLAINYAVSGNKSEAQKAANEALNYAPNEEAKKKFSEFLKSLFTEKKQLKTPTIPKSTVPTQFVALDSYLRSNPIAGPKYIRIVASSRDVMDAHFSNFPMSAMPTFAKEKFYSGIKEEVSKHPEMSIFVKLRFLDHSTGEVLAELLLNTK
ncbi:MAG: hypothetical protein SGJ02_00715 [bacterium]|nr:hypothetical protein [bacterium]